MAEVAIKMDVALVRDEGGDWAGLYLDGKLKREGHDLDLSSVLDDLGIDHSFTYVHVGDSGHLPANLDEVLSADEHRRREELERAKALVAEAEAIRESVRAERRREQYGGQHGYDDAGNLLPGFRDTQFGATDAPMGNTD